MNNSNLSVLLTGAGAPGIRGTIYCLRNNFDNKAVRIVGTDVKKDVVGRYLVDTFYTVPPPEDASYIDALIEICEREEVSILIPQTTRETSVISQHKQGLEDNGILTMVSEETAIKTANNKWLLLNVFQEKKLPFPQYYLARTEAELVGFASELGYPDRPVVVKPPISNGMRGLRILRKDAWDTERFLHEKPSGVEISLLELLEVLHRGSSWPELVVTEYLPGPEYSVDAYVGNYGEVAIPRLRKAIRSGISFENTLEFRTDLREYTLTAAHHIGLRYAFGFQFKVGEDGIPKILECNPRIQGTMVASAFSGINVIWLAVKDLLGEASVEIPTITKSASFYRFWGGLGVCDGEVYEI